MQVAHKVIHSGRGKNRKVIQIIKTQEQYGFAVSKEKPDLRKAIDDQLTAIMRDGTYATILNRATIVRPSSGQTTRMTGVMIDATQQAEADAHREMLSQELSDRLKNTLAMVQAIMVRQRVSARSGGRPALLA